MRHRRSIKSFSRKPKARASLVRGLVCSLVEHGRIRTTLAKAKELRRHVEKAVTKGKDGTVHCRRVLNSQLSSPATVKTIVDDLSVRFKERPGGYTRIIKLGRRPGDSAEMAFIEFVDYDFEKAAAAREENQESPKVAIKREATYKRRKRKLQQQDRQIFRRVNG